MAVRLPIFQLVLVLVLLTTLSAPPPPVNSREIWEGDWAVVQSKKAPISERHAPIKPYLGPEVVVAGSPLEEPKEEAEDYAELLKVDWTLFSEIRTDFLPTDLDAARMQQKTQRFKAAICDPSREKNIEEEQLLAERCCEGGKHGGSISFLTDNLFIACSNYSTYFGSDTLCSLYYTICCEQKGLKEFYMKALKKSIPKKMRKKKEKKMNT